MQTTDSAAVESQASGPPANVYRIDWPIRDNPGTSCAIIAAALVVATGVAVLGESRVMGVVAFLAFAVSIWRMWIPVQFELGPKGIIQIIFGRRQRMPWSAIRQCRIRRHGILLLTSTDESPAAVLRGLYVRWGRQRPEVLAIVNFYLAPRVIT